MIEAKIKSLSNYCSEVIKTWGSFFVINFCVSVGIFFCLISNHLENHLDSLWHTTHWFSGNWELTEGRWFWYYTDQLKMGMAFDPFSSFLAIILLIAGLMVFLSIFDLKPDNKISYLISILYICSTSVVCWLSFRYMSQVFFTSFLMSMLAMWSIVKIKNNVLSVVLAIFCINLSMGCYQAFLNCTCVCILATIALYLYQNRSPKEVITHFVKCVISVIGGGLFYMITLKIILALHGLEKSSYNGMGDISILGIIASLPNSFVKTYHCTKEYFFGNQFSYNYFQSKSVFLYVIFALIIIYLVAAFLKIFKENKVYAVLFIVCFLLLPAAANAVLVLATESFVSIQMTTAVTILFPVFLCLTSHMTFDFKAFPYIKAALIAISCVVLYGNYLAVSIDQEACLEGRTATQTLAQDIIGALREDGYMDRGGKIIFVGTPSGNERFTTSDLYPYANSLQRFGDWGPVYDANRMSWSGVFRELCGYTLDVAPDDIYAEIVESGITDNMPQFPKEGSIRIINDVTVVKVGDNFRLN